MVGAFDKALFRPSRPDFIETLWVLGPVRCSGVVLFRPSRPDFIETFLYGVTHAGGTRIVPAF